MSGELVVGILALAVTVLGALWSFFVRKYFKPKLRIEVTFGTVFPASSDRQLITVNTQVVNVGSRVCVLCNALVPNSPIDPQIEKEFLKHLRPETTLYEKEGGIRLEEEGAYKFCSTLSIEEARDLGDKGLVFVLDTRGRIYKASFNTQDILRLDAWALDSYDEGSVVCWP